MTPAAAIAATSTTNTQRRPKRSRNRVAQLQPGEERGDADHRGAGAERDRRVSERGLHEFAAFFVSTFGGV